MNSHSTTSMTNVDSNINLQESLKDAKLDMKAKQEEDKKTPPMPSELFDWSEKDKEHLQFKGDLDNYVDRLKFKVFGCWMMWIDLVYNEKFTEIMGDEKYKEGSDEFFIRSVFVNMIDRLGKLLSNTDIVREMAYLLESESKYEKDDDEIKINYTE